MKRKLGEILLAASFLLPAFALDLGILATVASACHSCKVSAQR